MNMEQKNIFSKKFFKNFLKIVFFFFLFFNYLFSISNEEVVFLANQKYSQLSGFSSKNSINDQGKCFEFLSALWAEQELHENILGFNLDLCILKQKKDKCSNKIRFFEQSATEYDVVTDHFLIESKSSSSPNLYTKIEQLKKEKNTIELCREILNNHESRFLEFSFMYRGKKPWIGVKGLLERNKKMFFTSKMIRGGNEKELLSQWFELIKTIAKRELLVFFRSPIDTELVSKLQEHDITFYDKIDSLDSDYDFETESESSISLSQDLQDKDIRDMSPQNMLDLGSESTFVSINSGISFDDVFCQNDLRLAEMQNLEVIQSPKIL
ncbi:hypothetical protein K9L05_00865 [Candidatus Babeliales bacterium]|nr:hypothetical protein [Candidatus Babeliales bacterium]